MKKIIFNSNNIKGKYGNGIEGDIFYYKRNNEIVFLKLLKRNIEFNDEVKIISDEIMENKRKKLEFISESPLFSDEIKLYDLVYDENDNFIGYTMKIDSLKTSYDINSTKRKIEVLKLLREKVEHYNKNNIYIGDFNQKNILVTNDGIKLCDLDNIKIEDYDFDLPGIFVLDYLSKFNDNTKIDNYSFNLETICHLGRIYQPYLFYNLKNNGLPRKIDTKRNRILINKILQNKNYDNQYLIDDVKKFL